MEFKGTKGYYIEDGYLKDENHEIIGDFFITDEKDKANALLISKSPEMLEALIEALKFAKMKGNEIMVEYFENTIKQATEL